MYTIWTGNELILKFVDREIKLTLTETEEFEKWVMKVAKTL